MGPHHAKQLCRSIAPWLLLALLAGCSKDVDDSQTTAKRGLPLEWDELPPWPDGIGVGGPLAGVTDDVLIIAGGANFPDAPPWEGGAKVWSDRVWVLERDGEQWSEQEPLSARVAYGSSVETQHGLILLGGSDGEGMTAAVRMASWNEELGHVMWEALPDLPTPMAFGSAGLVGDQLLVFPGKRSKRADHVEPGFWGLDLSAPRERWAWRELAPLPAAPRAKTVAAVQKDGFGEQHFYLISGELTTLDADGEAHYEFLAEAWRFDASDGELGSWSPIAPPPRAVAAGSALPFGQSHVLVFSGVRGAQIHLPIQERTGFTSGVLAYHTITDTWVEAGEMPVGVVTTEALTWGEELVITSGELRPGVRTPGVQRARRVAHETSFGALNYAVLALYLGSLVLMGWYFSRREASAEDYLLGGRRVPWWAAGLSIFGTMLSAITFLSTPAVGFATNCLIAPAWITILLIAPLVVHAYLPFFRGLDITTAYEYLEKRFGLALRLFGALSFTLFQVGRMAVVVYLPALALATFTGLDVVLCILLIGVLSTLYTTLGGIEAVIWTDVVQVVVLMGALFVALWIALSDVGGPGSAFELARAGGKLTAYRGGWDWVEMSTWIIVVGSFFLNFGPYTTDQATIQRYLTTKDEKSAARGIWLNGLMSVPGGLLFFGLGIALFAWFQIHPGALAIGMKTDEVLPLFVSERLPAGLSGLIIAGVFAASMSSLDSSMHGIATVVTTDFYGRFKRSATDASRLRVARVTTVLMGALGSLAALFLAERDVPSLFFWFLKLLGLVSSGLAGVFFLGIFTRRTTSSGALVGAITSTSVVAWVTFATDLNFYLYGLVGMMTCIVVGYTSSLVLPAGKRDISGLTLHTRRSQG
jgi:SSS family solute:Na+ symporter